MDLNETAAFVAVARHGSFTAAESATAVGKSTLSRRVKRLEERLGAKLLHRTTRRISLTEAGRAYFEQCERAIDRVLEAEHAVEQLREFPPSGVLRIATPPMNSEVWALLELERFLDEFPHVHLDIHESQHHADLVADGFDLALRGGELKGADLVGRLLIPSELFFVASPGYLAERGEPRTLADLETHDVLMFRPGHQHVALPFQTAEGVVRWLPSARVSVNSFHVIRALAVAGHGVALCELAQTLDDLEAGRLVRVLDRICLHGDGGFWIVRPAGRLVPPKVRVFIDHIVAAVQRTLLPRIEAFREAELRRRETPG